MVQVNLRWTKRQNQLRSTVNSPSCEIFCFYGNVVFSVYSKLQPSAIAVNITLIWFPSGEKEKAS